MPTNNPHDAKARTEMSAARQQVDEAGRHVNAAFEEKEMHVADAIRFDNRAPGSTDVSRETKEAVADKAPNPNAGMRQQLSDALHNETKYATGKMKDVAHEVANAIDPRAHKDDVAK